VNAIDNRPLKDRTVLVSSSAASAELRFELQRFGARVVTSPKLEINEPPSYVTLDEAIENLFGYDWIIFANVHAVDYFLRRFRALHHDVSELDELRVCAIGEASSIKLNEAHVHIDLIAAGNIVNQIISTLEAYLGGRAALSGANFLIPKSAMSVDPVPPVLEAADARVDVVMAYRTTPPTDSSLSQLKALLVGGGVDFVAFAGSSDVELLAELLDTTDLSQILSNVVVACLDHGAVQTAKDFGVIAAVTPAEPSLAAFVEAIRSFQHHGH
jgi:uroporphyrinogen III methyltransferase/synthase